MSRAHPVAGRRSRSSWRSRLPTLVAAQPTISDSAAAGLSVPTAGRGAAPSATRRHGRKDSVRERGERFERDELLDVEAVTWQRVEDALSLRVVLGGRACLC